MNTHSITSGYSEEIRSLFDAARKRILDILPDCKEEWDFQAGLLGFCLADGYKGTIFTLMPAKGHVTFGFYNGGSLSDPHHLLEGTGKVHRHIKLRTVEQLNSAGFFHLLVTALDASKVRLGV
ncbi:MAG: hypothetical protein CVU42_08060 [Chloroflexi bacterium HGW-Chloroflexi-4]|jgi:hypothetical protein|nr:MAG: hypothetical protein CVU43_16095 [Chloroflexi bacterium HGW-Chloroflexi-5]PKN99442.1 MAG: hypothetical protein CVU42_08060 [Chloroflexi bacterium HGW-Chloroflexi-4]